MRTWLTLLLLAAPLFLIYAANLEHAPVYLAHDEVLFALEAHSIASTGRDLTGDFLPLYFHVSDMWAQPVLIYLTALFLKVLPLSESVIRLPTALVGTIDVVLMYFLAEHIFKSSRLAIVAAALLALTPAHFIHSRLAMDYIYPLPFILAWLLCLVALDERHTMRRVFAATVFLAAGFYSYIASTIMMPIYFAATCLWLFPGQERAARGYVVACLGFALPLLLLIPWVLHHPAVYGEQVRRYGLYDSTHLGPFQGMRDFLSFNNIQDRIAVYWDFFNPSYLFLSCGSSIINSTRKTGVFLLSLAVLLPLGLYRIATRPTRVNLLLLFGFASSPLAASLINERYAIDRELAVLPFGVLIATYGLEALLTARQRLWRMVAGCLLVLIPIQFAYFSVDYFTDYRLRSSVWFERNIRGALEDIIAREQPGRARSIYLSSDIPFIEAYWRLYLIKHHREDLLNRTVSIDPRNFTADRLPSQSVLLARLDDTRGEALSGALRPTSVIREPDGTKSFAIFER